MNSLSAVKQCPKCAYGAPEPFTECPRCGVVVLKYRRFGLRDTSPTGADSVHEGRAALFLATPEQVAPVVFWLRVALWTGLAIWGFRLALASIESNAAGESSPSRQSPFS